MAALAGDDGVTALPRLVLVVARARNGVIGQEGGLPWRLRTDLRRFKTLTIGKPCIMGRRTWESLPLKPLPGRLNLVLSKDESFEPREAVACLTLDEAIEIGREQAQEDGADEVCVIGGAGVFASVLPRAKRLYLTEVDAEPEGDVSFPSFDEAAWTEISSEAIPAGEADDHSSVFRVLERR
jgi:dihydrofolate reductase